MRKILRIVRVFFALVLVLMFSSLLMTGCSHTDLRRADKSSVGIAPKPEEEPRAVVQVYAARTVRWRRYFAVHSWIAYKEKDAQEYNVLHVVGWRVRRGLPAIVNEKDLPDRKWFGNEPTLLLDLRGAPAERAIPKIVEASQSYPYQNFYRIYPGPNSNTFISYILRRVPELEVELPPHAIGKDWIDDGDFFGRSESGTGMQFSVYGLLGLTLGLAEGIEVNILGMTFGLDVWRPALKLPFIGRVGFADDPIFVKSEP